MTDILRVNLAYTFHIFGLQVWSITIQYLVMVLRTFIISI